MTRYPLSALALLLVTVPLGAEDDGNKLLFAALGRDDAIVVPLWPKGIGPGETKAQLGNGVLKSPNDSLVFRPVVNAEMIVIPPPKGTRSTGVAVMICPGGGYGALETQSITQGSKW